MVKFLLASALIFAVMVGWLYVQDIYRRFARRNPQMGPFRSEAVCQGSCGCHQGSCRTREPESMAVAGPPTRGRFTSTFVEFRGALR